MMETCKSCKFFSNVEEDLRGKCEVIKRTVMSNDSCGCFEELDNNTETCVSCGETIPEGRQVCPKCMSKAIGVST